MSNPWPTNFDDADDSPRSPYNVLVEIAAGLSSRTGNRIQAEVFDNAEFGYDPESETEYPITRDSFGYDLALTSYQLPGYRYKLLSVKYDIGYYPVEVRLDQDIAAELALKIGKVTLVSEDAFRDQLPKFLNTKKVGNVVRAMMQHTRHNPGETMVFE